MTSVTVTSSAHGRLTTIPASSADSLQLAQQITALIDGGGRASAHTVTASTGSVAVDAADARGTVVVHSAAANILFIGGHSPATVFGGSGSDTLKAACGSVTLVVADGLRGQSTFDNFVHGLSKVSLIGYPADEEIDAVAMQSHANGATTISLSDGTKITFLYLAQLKVSDFI